MAPGLLAGAGGETRKAMLRHLPQHEHFSKSKLTQRNKKMPSPLPYLWIPITAEPMYNSSTTEC